MVIVFVSGSRGPGSRPHSAFLHPGVYMGTGELNAGCNPAMDQPRRIRDGLASLPRGSGNVPSCFMLLKPGETTA